MLVSMLLAVSSCFWLILAVYSWDLKQMLFGDGNELAHNFTGAIDVIGHELAHAVTWYHCPLTYNDQSGALNEHVSDVIGFMVRQWSRGESSAISDWLIGEDCLMPGVKGVALRSMKDPGTAFDDLKLVSPRAILVCTVSDAKI